MLEEIDRGVHGLRIGVDETYISGNTDPQLVESVLAGIGVLERLGAVLVKIQMPDISDYMEAFGVLCSAEALAAHEATFPSRRDDYGPCLQGWLDKGASVTGAEYAKANNVRSACRGLLSNLFENIDVIGCPTMTTPPFPITLEEMYGPMFLLDDPNWGKFTVPYDFSGAPTISLPCGQNRDGLPLSIQFVGKHLSEPLLCRVGHTFEQATEWHGLRPNIE
jgi:amidase